MNCYVEKFIQIFSSFKTNVCVARSDVFDFIEKGLRIQSISYVLRFMAVLTVVHAERDGATHVINFCPASSKEREVNDAWLENECNEP